MSSKFKKLLMGLVLIPSLTLTAACGKDDDSEKGVASNAKAYETLQTLSNEILDENNAIAFDVTSESDTTVDFGDVSGYSNTIQAALAIVAAKYSSEETEIIKEQYGYDFTNGIGYGVTYGDEEKSYVEDGYYLIKNGSNYVLYKTYYDDDLKQNRNSAYYVGSDHLKVEYYEDLEDYVFLLNLIADNDQLSGLKEAIVQYFNGNMDMGEGATLTVSEFGITKSKGINKLKLVASADIYQDILTEDAADEEQEPMMTMTIGFSVSFDSEKIIEIVTEASFSYSMDFSLSEFDPSLTEKISMIISANEKATINNFSTTLDSTIMGADYSSFGIIQKPSSYVNYYIDGVKVRYYEGRFENVLTLLTNGDEELGSYIHATITSWYLDEECTIPATNITEFPSYDLDLYAKVTGVKEGYALIRSKLTSSYDYTVVQHKFIDVSEVTTMTLAQLKASFAPMIASNIKVNGTAVEDDYVFNFTSETIYEVECDYSYGN